MTAYRQAVKDIKADLSQSAKVFLAYRRELDPVMKHLTEDYISLQTALDKKKGDRDD